MANKYWIGAATNTTEVRRFTPSGSLAAGEVVGTTILGVGVYYVIQLGDTLAQICNGLASAINAATASPYWREGTASSSGTYVDWMQNEPGRPALATPQSDCTGGTTTVGVSLVQAATGRNWADNPDNWSGATLPSAADDVFWLEGSTSCMYGLDHFASTQFASATVGNGYSGWIGLPSLRAAYGLGTTAMYAEQLPQYFQAGITKLTVGKKFAQGPRSGLLRFDVDGQTDVVCEVTGLSADPAGLPAFCWRGNHTANSIAIHGGDFGQLFAGDKIAAITQTGGRSLFVSPDLTSGGLLFFLSGGVALEACDLPVQPFLGKNLELVIRGGLQRSGVEVFGTAAGTLRLVSIDPGQAIAPAFG